MQLLWPVAVLALASAPFTRSSAIRISEKDVPTSDVSDPVNYNSSLEEVAMSARAPAVFGEEYTGQAVVEMSVASDNRQNIGDHSRAGLYKLIYDKLVELCPDGQDECNTEQPATFKVRWLDNAKQYDPIQQNGGWGELRVTGYRFKSNQARRLMIGSIAGAYEAMTENERNCFDLTCSVEDEDNPECFGRYDPDWTWDGMPNSDNNNRFCSVAPKVSVFAFSGYLSVELRTQWHNVRKLGWYHMGAWRCCETRDTIDAKLDGLKDEMTWVMGAHGDRYRLVRCTGGCTNNQRDYKVNVDEVLRDVINHMG